jgi:hypothetical protein
MGRIIIVDIAPGTLGPWNGPFSLEDPQSELAQVVSGYVMKVVAGVSSYNKKAWEESSLLRSYAVECFEEIREETPEAAALLENLQVDLTGLSTHLREHAIWTLSRAILGCLPGICFIE